MSDDSFRQERDKVPFKRLMIAAAGLTVIGVILVTWSWLTLRSREAALRPSGGFPERTLGPRREISGVEEELFGERGEGQMLTLRERASLERFGWVDHQLGTIRIPIDVAMDLVVRETEKTTPANTPRKDER